MGEAEKGEGSNVLCRVRKKFRLFKNPLQVGQVIEDADGSVLIIGIENYELIMDTIVVCYTCQYIGAKVSQNKAQPNEFKYFHSAREFEIQAKYNDHVFHGYQMGCTFNYNGLIHKVIEFTEISLVGSDLKLSFMARPIYPVSEKEVRTKMLSDKRKRLKLEVL